MMSMSSELGVFLTPFSSHRIFVRYGKKQKRRKDDIRFVSPHVVTLLRKEERSPSETALHYFDSHYGKVFGVSWHSIRLSLLSPPKYMALLNNYSSQMSETISALRELGAEDFEFYSESSSSESICTESPLISSRNWSPEHSSTTTTRRRSQEKENISEDSPNIHFSLSVEEGNERIIEGNESDFRLLDFSPVKSLKGMEDFLEESDYYDSYNKNSETSLENFSFCQVWKSKNLCLPKHFRAFTFPSGQITRFPTPKRTLLSNFNYYCMNGASILPVWALEVKPGDFVLDLCGGPGGKSLAILQTLYPSKLLINDSSISRLKRIKNVMDSYIGACKFDQNLLEFKCSRGETFHFEYGNSFDKVLVDVPCFTDRSIVSENENNIFHPLKKKERINLPIMQIQLLLSAMKCVKPGGTVVYSTCTLSPIQNDGVIHSALKEIWENTRMEFALVDLSEALTPFRKHFIFSSTGAKYGQLVLPNLSNNFGPMYFAKLKRLL